MNRGERGDPETTKASIPTAGRTAVSTTQVATRAISGCVVDDHHHLCSSYLKKSRTLSVMMDGTVCSSSSFTPGDDLENMVKNNDNVGEELPFHHKQHDAPIEQCISSSNIGNVSTVFFESDNGGIFYDSVEEQFEEVECDPGNTIATASTKANTDGNLKRADGQQQSSNMNTCGLPFFYNSESEEEDLAFDNRRKSRVLRMSEVSQLSFVSSFQNDPPFNEESRRLKITQSKKYTELLESVNVIAQMSEVFFFNNGMTVALGSLFLAMNVIVAAHAAYQYSESGGFTTDDDILRVTLPIARVGGRLVTFNCAWLLLTGCKYSWTMIRTTVVPIIPIGFPIDDIMPKYHRFVALWIIVSGLIVHAIPQIVNYATGAIQIDDGSKIWTYGKGPATRQLLITGTLLTLIFTTFYLTTLPAFRKTAAGFRWFWFFHMGGIALAYPLLIIHGTCKGSPLFLACALAPLALYLFDVMMRRSKITKTKTLEWRTHVDRGERITELIVECPPNFVYTPGQYAELKFHPLSSHEWHPFTIASAPNNDVRIYDGKRVKVLIFYIKSVGRWTEALFNYASVFDRSNPNTAMEIYIRGPHGAPSMSFFEYKHIIVIGAGVGVTPLLSVWQYVFNQACSMQRNDNDLQSKLPRVLSRGLCFHSDDDPTVTFSVGIDPASGFRSACSNVKGILGSLTVSIGLFGFFLIGESIIGVYQIFGYYAMVASTEIIFASFSLIFRTVIITVSALTHKGGMDYFRHFKSWIEVSLFFVDAANLWLSISVLKKDELLVDEHATRWIVGLGGTSVFINAIRIFHIFYTVLKPKTEKRNAQKRVCYLQGIFINRHYTGMRFCFDQLLQPLEEGLSKVFSMQFYGTRETADERPPRHNLSSPDLTLPDGAAEGTSKQPSSKHKHQQHTLNQSEYYSFHSGHPDWELIFHQAIRKSCLSDPNGDSIGVFFCGSPAIAKCLRSTADKVNAQHRFATKKKTGKASKCKIVVHIETY
jgi:predicted ferric reductase